MKFIVNKENPKTLSDVIGITAEQEEITKLKIVDFFNKYTIKLFREKGVSKLELLEELEDFSSAELAILLTGCIVFQMETVINISCGQKNSEFDKFLSELIDKLK